MRPDLIEELRDSYDFREDPWRELARCEALMEEAAEAIVEQQKLINHLFIWMESGQALMKGYKDEIHNN